jgi:hypothetical protein
MKGYNQFVACLKEENLADRLKSILLQNPTACMNLDKNKWPHDFEDVAVKLSVLPIVFCTPQ